MDPFTIHADRFVNHTHSHGPLHRPIVTTLVDVTECWYVHAALRAALRHRTEGERLDRGINPSAIPRPWERSERRTTTAGSNRTETLGRGMNSSATATERRCGVRQEMGPAPSISEENKCLYQLQVQTPSASRNVALLGRLRLAPLGSKCDVWPGVALPLQRSARAGEGVVRESEAGENHQGLRAGPTPGLGAGGAGTTVTSPGRN
eukprot:1188888-Prorocentrum_minimum.AAC.1